MDLTRRLFTGALVAGIAAPGLSACATSDAGADSPVLTEAMAGKSVPGMTALVIRDFRVETEFVAGVGTLGSSEPVKAGERWHIGSNGKAMTATMGARLVEAGVLAWDKPLSQMLDRKSTR